MGYTQHWSLAHIEESATSTKVLQSALNDMVVVLEPIKRVMPEMFIGDIFDEESCYFYITRNSQGDVMSIAFGDVVESFQINNQALVYKTGVGNYIKTMRSAYDLAVVACLTILANAFDDEVVANSDGNADDWIMGGKLAAKILGRELRNPRYDPQFSVSPLEKCQHFELYNEILAAIESLKETNEGDSDSQIVGKKRFFPISENDEKTLPAEQPPRKKQTVGNSSPKMT